jgi:hypothetical protein
MNNGFHELVPIHALQRQGTRLRTKYAWNGFSRIKTAVVVISSLIYGCRTPQAKPEPSIEFSKIPPAAKVAANGWTLSPDVLPGLVATNKLWFMQEAGRGGLQPWPDHPQLSIQHRGMLLGSRSYRVRAEDLET